MKDLDYIKKFSKITIKDVCKKAKVDRSNLMSGKVKEEKVKLVKEIIQEEIAKLYIRKDDDKNESK